MAKESYTFNKRSRFKECPRCKELLRKSAKFCVHCGIVFENQKKIFSIQGLRFGKKHESAPIKVVDDTSITYSQNLSKTNYLLVKLCNVFFFIVGLFSSCMLFLPLFSNKNIGTYISEVASSYKFTINEYLLIDSSTNFFALFKGLIEFLKEGIKVFNPNMILVIYEMAVCFGIIILALCGLTLMTLSVISFIKGKQNHLCKKFAGIILATNLVLLCFLNCYGVGPDSLSTIGIACLIFLYVCSIISKEKQFLPRQFIHKSISFVLLVFLLVLSSLGLFKLNVTLGSNVYLFESLANSSSNVDFTIVPCRGMFLEYIQFVHSSSGDELFKTLAFDISLLSFIFHIIYVLFAIFACVSVLKSLSVQSIRFPYKKVIVSTVAFYVFAILMYLFLQLVNEVAYESFVSAMGQNALAQLSKEEIEKIKEANEVFSLRPTMIISLCLYLPTCIYTVIAKNICLRKSYN